jgi:hypothetical protein
MQKLTSLMHSLYREQVAVYQLREYASKEFIDAQLEIDRDNN